MDNRQNPPRPKNDGICVILAGGNATRMDGRDKAELMIGGERMIDRVHRRVVGQAKTILISGQKNYGVGAIAVPDLADGPRGPAAGLFAALSWTNKNMSAVKGFCTVPVDAPFVPLDMISQLEKTGDASVAFDGRDVHPTFAYWHCEKLAKAFEENSTGGIALHHLARKLDARPVRIETEHAFINVNSPIDLENAKAICPSVQE